MISLSISYPQVNEYLEKGGLSVQLGSVNKFGRIPVDQATEETANREIKSPGGTMGFSAGTSVVTPKYIRAHTNELRNTTDDNKSSFDHPDLRISRFKQDERGVKLLLEMFENQYRYPFVFDAGDFYSEWKAVKVSGKEVILKADQNLLDCSDRTTEYERGVTMFSKTLSVGISNWRGLT